MDAYEDDNNVFIRNLFWNLLFRRGVVFLIIYAVSLKEFKRWKVSIIFIQ